jgi:hypothetical protein
MARYLMLWELDQTKVSADRKERAALWAPMVEGIKKRIQAGRTKDWGCFAGGMKGFSVHEGDEMTVSNAVQSFLPYVKFEVHQIISIEQLGELVESLKK